VRVGSKAQLREALLEVRAQVLELLAGLQASQWTVPVLAHINPPAWEFGHLAWFQEFWCVRSQMGELQWPSCLPEADSLYNSSSVAHGSRWSLDLLRGPALIDYMQRTLENTLRCLDQTPDTDTQLYFFRLAVFHERMHVEALLMTWESLAYDLPARWNARRVAAFALDRKPNEFLIPAGEVTLGAMPDSGFVFDNEKWATVRSEPAFRIASNLVTNAEFLEFVNSGAYTEPLERWRQPCAAQLSCPAAHVSGQEAQAYCDWIGKSLPSESQWLRAIQVQPDIIWGQQLWEWTRTLFAPLPGFSPDPYQDYSQPWFGDHLVVKGGSWATHHSLSEPVFRNFYQAHRADPFIGFRVCSPAER
jgi:gamma-glutamyl hercynylcysteine S-oxide synthase